MKHTESFDIAVVGAGAAGLMAAIASASKNPHLKIALFDTREKIGAKILISGGTRCNVTNVQVTPQDYEGGPKHFVKHVLQAFSPDETRQFFENIGVQLVLEPTGKYFPVSNSGKTVLEALVKEIKRLGVQLICGIKIGVVKKEGDKFILNSDYHAKKVILATGGLSYPETGSDGTGFEIAKSFGHTLIPTHAALTPLLTQDEDWKSLSGVALDAKLTFFKNNKKEADRQGALLFTHFGFSGPAALDISRFFSTSLKEDKPQIFANFVPKYTEEEVLARFDAALKSNPRKFLKNFLTEEFSLPSRFVETFFKKIDCEENTLLRDGKKKDRTRFFHALLHYPLEVSGVYGYKKAEVTAGGVDLKEVKFSTMESKLVPGLFFCGEILDIDGRIGGFNFQWAWSTGQIAGCASAS